MKLIKTDAGQGYADWQAMFQDETYKNGVRTVHYSHDADDANDIAYTVVTTNYRGYTKKDEICQRELDCILRAKREMHIETTTKIAVIGED